MTIPLTKSIIKIREPHEPMRVEDIYYLHSKFKWTKHARDILFLILMGAVTQPDGKRWKVDREKVKEHGHKTRIINDRRNDGE